MASGLRVRRILQPESAREAYALPLALGGVTLLGVDPTHRATRNPRGASHRLGGRARPRAPAQVHANGDGVIPRSMTVARASLLVALLASCARPAPPDEATLGRTSMLRCEEAVGTGKPETMLWAIQAQAAIERRALTTVAAVQERR